ncbi:DUF2252 family protein [Phenylobacterium sp. LjRoot225]|uniref:DUF2252 family protein n=1 Tax=Phenylobacterium sp. LjRoot225 TaxID=3342285 RepID=UPI003ECC93F2
MGSFDASMAAYEASLRKLFGPSFRERDLARKHARMREDAFQFLRGACWRWAETAAALCPDLMNAPAVGSVGDAHAGNFGLWRDAEFRLVFGVNDFDEACVSPYPLDLVRLCASMLIAEPVVSAEEVADRALQGYLAGLQRPAPFVLESEHLWLRDAFAATEEVREDFWRDLEASSPETAPASYDAQLRAALPGVSVLTIVARTAGVGGLGRPRFVAFGRLRGGPAAREIKGRAPSCWGGQDAALADRLATGPWRSPDPFLSYGPNGVVRRLAPNSRKLKFGELRRRRTGRLMRAMAADLAAIHAAEAGAADAILRDLEARPKDWLARAARQVAAWTKKEFRAYA